MPSEIVTVEHKGLPFEIVTIEHKGLPSKIVTVKEIGLRIILFYFISIFNFRKTIFKLYDKFRKKNGNDMTANVAQPERNNIKYYA